MTHPRILAWSLVAALAACPAPSNSPDAGDAPSAGPACPLTPAELWRRDEGLVIFSSPRAVDLDEDGVLDLVVGRGGDDEDTGAVSALSGRDGSGLWRQNTARPVVGSATLVDLDGAAPLDIVIGGRDATLLAIAGGTGALLWRFDPGPDPREAGWYNFYTSQPLPDVDDDGVPDLLAANGGDGLAPPFWDRPEGHLVVISGADGAVIARLPTPDGRETYVSPLLLAHPSGTQVLFGTGGETHPGALYRIPLGAVLDEDPQAAVTLLTGSAKGFIAPPSLADLDSDGVEDIVVASFDGRLVAIGGADDEVLWTVEAPGHETYVSPGIGYLDDDDAPDVFAQFSAGIWPNYTGARHLAVDGRTGALLYSEDFGVLVSSGPLLADLDEDGRDEALFGVNEAVEGGTSFSLYRLDLEIGEAAPFLSDLGALSFAAPWLGELDGDGCLDLVVSAGTERSGLEARATLFRFSLPTSAEARVSWGAYLGSSYAGR